ncbi:hypothetical protein, partial [Chryseobacterium viscerum]|uniref:hypothetical protein n=1 Tax=Chryseobacterium viscerum TaxID=1037377 RepID=UPI0022232042
SSLIILSWQMLLLPIHHPLLITDYSLPIIAFPFLILLLTSSLLSSLPFITPGLSLCRSLNHPYLSFLQIILQLPQS